MTDPLGAASAYTYDAAGNLSTVRENGSETRYRYDKAGNIVGLTDAEGRAVGFVYDALGNLTETRYPDGTKATNAYDVMGRLIESVPRHGVKTTYVYDAAGRVTKVTEGERVTRYAYDLAGNLTQETDAMGGKQRYAYDAIGRLVSVTDANGNTTAYGYDALDNLISVLDANGHETRYAYDPLSRLRTETDARGNTTAYDYTPEGWLKQTTRPDGTTLSYVYDKTGYLLKETASDGTEIRHAFDALGELTEIEDETGTTRLRYDERGLLIGVENPLGEHVQYTYNAYGEKIGITYPDGKQATYTYDALSRLLSVTEPNGNKTTYTYDALGRRTSTSDGTATTAYRYDKVGNLTRQTNDAVTLTYKHDLNGRMIGETREEGKTVTRTNYAYDKAGQLLSFRRSDGNAERYKYDPAGNMVEKTQNGVKIAMTYTAANELQSMESPHGKLTYAYDQNGNLTQKTYNGRTDTYSYDARNHLRQYRGYDNYTVKYSYNALGMLHAKEATGSNTRTTLEELIAGKEAADDPDGDGQAHLTTYTYDLTQPYYEVLTETTDGTTTSYTYGLERLAAYTESTRTAYLYDGRGSVAQTIQTNNGSFADAIRSSKAYSPFGELLTEKTSGYGFNGEYFDAATGMLNLRARQYEPAQARFSQKDSEKGNVANAKSLNAYLYCYNDDVNYFDASGAKPEAVRNNTTVDAGDGGSYAARTANQIAAEAYKSAMVSTVGVSHGGHSGKIPNSFDEHGGHHGKIPNSFDEHGGHYGKIPVNSTPVPGPASSNTSVATPGPQEVEKYRKKNVVGPTPPAANNSRLADACNSFPITVEIELQSSEESRENYIFFSYITGESQSIQIGEGRGVFIGAGLDPEEGLSNFEFGAITQFNNGGSISGKAQGDFKHFTFTVELPKNENASTAISLKADPILHASLIIEDIISIDEYTVSSYKEIKVNKWVIGLAVAANFAAEPAGSAIVSLLSKLAQEFKKTPSPTYGY